MTDYNDVWNTCYAAAIVRQVFDHMPYRYKAPEQRDYNDFAVRAANIATESVDALKHNESLLKGK